MIRHGTRHVPTRWLSLFTMFKAVEGFGANDCLTPRWIFHSEQGNEMASDEQPTEEVFHQSSIYDTHDNT